MAEIRMVEKVARAIDPLAWVIPEGDYPAEKARREAKQFTSLSQARRAIEAMREPSEWMKECGSAPIRNYSQGQFPFAQTAGHTYRHMIDAALSEEVAG